MITLPLLHLRLPKASNEFQRSQWHHLVTAAATGRPGPSTYGQGPVDQLARISRHLVLGELDNAFEAYESAHRMGSISGTEPLSSTLGTIVHAEAGHLNRAIKIASEAVTLWQAQAEAADQTTIAELILAELQAVTGNSQEAERLLTPALVQEATARGFKFWPTLIQATSALVAGRPAQALAMMETVSAPYIPGSDQQDPLISISLDLFRTELAIECGFPLKASVFLARAQDQIKASGARVMVPRTEVLVAELQMLSNYAETPTGAGEIPPRDWSPLELGTYRRARGRAFALIGEREGVERSIQDIEIGTPATLAPRLDTQDLLVAVGKIEAVNSPRAFAMGAQFNHTLNWLHRERAEESNTPWGSIGRTIESVRATEQMEVDRDGGASADQLKVENQLNQIIKELGQVGMGRYQTRFEALRAAVQPHYQMEWIEKRGKLTRFIRQDAENFARSVVGRSPLGISVSASDTPIKIRSVEAQEHADLEINEQEGIILLNGQRLPIVSGSVLFRILTHLALSRGHAVNKADLVRAIWDKPYNSAEHDTLVYNAIRRLRMYLPIESSEKGYRVPDALTWDYVPALPHQNTVSTIESLNLSSRQSKILDFARMQPQRSVHRGQLVDGLGFSPRTALRELTALAGMGFLERVGAGRSARYVLNGTKSAGAL